MALRTTEQALLYNPRDKDLIDRKDKYYYSVMPDDLRARLDLVRNAFDVDYCMRRARRSWRGGWRPTRSGWKWRRI